ncbi:MAG: hypothetical protein WBP16_02645 [Ferruginibacter sp.]
MKNPSRNYFYILLVMFFISCEKQDELSPITVPPIRPSYISFNEDTIAVKLIITSARKEYVGSLLATAIDGKQPDSILQKNNLIIRVTGDSARVYSNTEIFASYTDSLGNSFATANDDTTNIVQITKFEKKADGIVEGSFTIRVSNFTKTKILLLNKGMFSTAFFE